MIWEAYVVIKKQLMPLYMYTPYVYVYWKYMYVYMKANASTCTYMYMYTTHAVCIVELLTLLYFSRNLTLVF